MLRRDGEDHALAAVIDGAHCAASSSVRCRSPTASATAATAATQKKREGGIRARLRGVRHPRERRIATRRGLERTARRSLNNSALCERSREKEQQHD